MDDVLIVGAGPTGLWLAAELRRGGVPDVTILEAREQRSPHSKALTVHARTLELFASRGALEPFLAEGIQIPTGHFGGLPDRVDLRVLDSPFPFTLAIPQARTEELLEEQALALGVRIRRGVKVTGLTRDAESVTVQVGNDALRARYVVGCDGTRSQVRTSAGIGYTGTDDTAWGLLGDVVLDEVPPAIDEPGYMAVPLPGGLHRVICTTSHRPEGPLTLEQFAAQVREVSGSDLGMRDPQWLSVFGNAARLADRYREGRVLLAGDAAHQHFPAGGVGMNVGLQDAHALGWRLARVAQKTSSEALLDDYARERRPVGADLLRSTQAQTVLLTRSDPDVRQLRALLSEFIATVPEFAKALGENLSGHSVRYPATPGDHPLTGTRLTSAPLTTTNPFDRLVPARPVLITSPGTTTKPTMDVDKHEFSFATADEIAAVLVRPDGHVAWVGTAHEDLADQAAAAVRELLA
ncbi:FAD-dependent monooxygenase [Kineosporia rhizophila]|nr:FAD-dependent monooxygenase [Kineosporia rhizophila]MCE0535867.1 FAD-dependent monooxygenase [Kineosporia rhizophila]